MSINEQSLGRSPPKLRVIEICVKQAALRGYIQYPFIETDVRACFGAGHCQGVPASRLALECHLASRAYGSKVVGPVSGVLMPVVQEAAALQPALTAAAVGRLVIAKLVLVPVRSKLVLVPVRPKLVLVPVRPNPPLSRPLPLLLQLVLVLKPV